MGKEDGAKSQAEETAQEEASQEAAAAEAEGAEQAEAGEEAAQGAAGEPTDRHGQPGINREKYQRDIEKRDAKSLTAVGFRSGVQLSDTLYTKNRLVACKYLSYLHVYPNFRHFRQSRACWGAGLTQDKPHIESTCRITSSFSRRFSARRAPMCE